MTKRPIRIKLAKRRKGPKAISNPPEPIMKNSAQKAPPNMTVHARKESNFTTANGNAIPNTVSPPNIGNKRQKTIGNNPYPNPSTSGSDEKRKVFANPKYYQALIIQYEKSTGKSARTCNPQRDNCDNHSTT